MAIIDKKQKRWYSKSTFDSLDKTTIPVGTEIQVAGELGQADFDSDTNTKLNAVPNKLDKPSGNPTEDSLVKVSSTGSVEYVPAGMVYLHTYQLANTADVYTVDIAFYSSKSTAYSFVELHALAGRDYFSSSNGLPIFVMSSTTGLSKGVEILKALPATVLGIGDYTFESINSKVFQMN